MADDLRTRACGSCGFPALTGTRRCPFCREPFPRPAPLTHGGRPDPLAWLAAGWAVTMAPLVMLALTTIGMPFTLPMLAAALVPGCVVWLLRRRTAMRIYRYRGGLGASRGAGTAADQRSHDPQRR